MSVSDVGTTLCSLIGALIRWLRAGAGRTRKRCLAASGTGPRPPKDRATAPPKDRPSGGVALPGICGPVEAGRFSQYWLIALTVCLEHGLPGPVLLVPGGGEPWLPGRTTPLYPTAAGAAASEIAVPTTMPMRRKQVIPGRR
jgi:hypothetical protein